MKDKSLPNCTECGTLIKLGTRFHPGARDSLSAFPEQVKKEFGFLIYQLQIGEKLAMPHSRPVKEVRQGVSELRVKGRDGIYRIFYYLKVSLEFWSFTRLKSRLKKRRNLKLILVEKDCLN